MTMMPTFGQVVLALYAVLLIVGGLLGFLKARSRPSLIAGLISGVLAGGCVAVSGPNKLLGYGLGLALALVMGVVFALRYTRTRKVMPSGMLALVSLAVVIALVVDYVAF